MSQKQLYSKVLQDFACPLLNSNDTDEMYICNMPMRQWQTIQTLLPKVIKKKITVLTRNGNRYSLESAYFNYK